jgi:hypothetical protein
MPLPVFKMYFAIDSLCRSLPSVLGPYVVGEILDDTVTTADLVRLLPNLYQTIDYDPYRFFAYLRTSKQINPKYKTTPGYIYDHILYRARKGEISKVGALLSLSAGIYFIKITHVSVDTLNFTVGAYRPEPIVCLSAQVITAL